MDKKRIYFENLDGIRAICFLSVFFYHSFHTEYSWIKDSSIYKLLKWDVFGNGDLGVNFFFVLSGFLITYLLLEEKKVYGKINVGKFWIRRILRIWPLFYLCVFFGFIIFPILKEIFGEVPNETANPIYYLLFLNNFDIIKNGLPDSSVLGVLWSVAIEEQFYLFWPLAIFVCAANRQILLYFTVIGISMVFRVNDIHKFHTLYCIGDMAVGAIAASLVRIPRWKKVIERFSKWQIAFLYSATIFLFLFRDELINEFYSLKPFLGLLIAIFFALIILEQSYSKASFFKLGRYTHLSSLGKISYGLYCLHFIGILIATNTSKLLGMNNSMFTVIIVDTALALAFTILLSWFSYRFFEIPFLNIKKRFSFFER